MSILQSSDAVKACDHVADTYYMTASKATASRSRTARPTATIRIPKVSVQRSTHKIGPKTGAALIGLVWWWTTHPEQTAIVTTAATAALKSAAAGL